MKFVGRASCNEYISEREYIDDEISIKRCQFFSSSVDQGYS